MQNRAGLSINGNERGGFRILARFRCSLGRKNASTAKPKVGLSVTRLPGYSLELTMAEEV